MNKKPIKEKENVLFKIATVAFFSIIILSSIIVFIKESRMDTHYRYTIAIPKKIQAAAEGGLHLNFFYFVMNKEYSGTMSIQRKQKKGLMGKRYYLKYYPPDPNIGEIFLDKPVPDSIKTAPPEGWEKIP